MVGAMADGVAMALCGRQAATEATFLGQVRGLFVVQAGGGPPQPCGACRCAFSPFCRGQVRKQIRLGSGYGHL